MVPLKGPQLNTSMMLQNYQDTRTQPGMACYLGSEVTHSKTTDTNLDCVFVENALVFIIPKVWGVP